MTLRLMWNQIVGLSKYYSKNFQFNIRKRVWLILIYTHMHKYVFVCVNYEDDL